MQHNISPFLKSFHENEYQVVRITLVEKLCLPLYQQLDALYLYSGEMHIVCEPCTCADIAIFAKLCLYGVKLWSMNGG